MQFTLKKLLYINIFFRYYILIYIHINSKAKNICTLNNIINSDCPDFRNASDKASKLPISKKIE